jgi:hypothetical protein
VNQFTDRMAKGLEEAKAALAKAQDEYARYYNRCRTPAPLFNEGDKVWLDASDIQTTRPSAKLAPTPPSLTLSPPSSISSRQVNVSRPGPHPRSKNRPTSPT